MCADGWPAMLACAPLTCLLCFLSPNTTHASGSILNLQRVSDPLAARHVVLVTCPSFAQMCSDGWPAMLACAPLTSLLCFLLPYPTYASGFFLILQLVSGWLASRHVGLGMRPRCADV